MTDRLRDRIEWMRRRAQVCGPEAAMLAQRLYEELEAVRELLWRDHDEGGEIDKTLRDLRRMLPRA